VPTGERVRAGAVPPLADGFSARPETAAALESALVPGATVALAPGRPTPGRSGAWLEACGKTQLAASSAEWLWHSGKVDLLVWAVATSRASVLSAYVEAAVMAPVGPSGLRVPMLLGGKHAARLAPTLAALGFDAKPASERIGAVSAMKMCRSVMVKGLEAITIECLMAARAYGVEDEVIASLAESYPQTDWERQAGYVFGRVIRHGRRRAEEMREAAATVREIGLDGCMAAATAQRQQWVADLARDGVLDPDREWRDAADAAVARMRQTVRAAD